MTQTQTKTSRVVAGALALALAFVSSAVCLAATLEMETTQQHAACAMGHESGSPDTTKLDCCIGQSPQFAGIAPDAGAPIVGQPPVISLIAATHESLVPAPPVLPAFDPDVSKPSDTPTYLLVSVFRI